jgi:hypothetical protein
MSCENNLNIGMFQGLKYDQCKYEHEIRDSIAPFNYNCYNGKYINVNDPIIDIPFDIESDLMNIKLSSSKCPENKYLPNNNVCTPLNNFCNPQNYLVPELCPPVNNNLVKIKNSGLQPMKNVFAMYE